MAWADPGRPDHLGWIVEFDKIGAVSVERYGLVGRNRAYSHIETTHRDMHGLAVDVTAPFIIRITWDQLVIAPRV